MAKLTTRTYYAQCNAITAKLEAVKAELESLDAQYDTAIAVADVIEHWNGLHDTERELKREREDLDRDFRRRNWNAYDWQQWELVSNNID